MYFSISIDDLIQFRLHFYSLSFFVTAGVILGGLSISPYTRSIGYIPSGHITKLTAKVDMWRQSSSEAVLSKSSIIMLNVRISGSL